MTGKRTIAICAAVAVLLAACVLPLQAAPGDKTDKPDPKAAGKTEPKAAAKTAPAKNDAIVVTAVTGLAQRRVVSGAKSTWEKVKVGDVLSELTVIRTGLGSKVVIRMGDRSEVTIKSATKVGITEFSRTDKVVKMRLGMKYGSMRASVDASRGANDFRVATPVATLSVRGSIGGWGFWGDRMVLGFYGSAGNWHADYVEGQTREVGPREWLGPDGKRTGDIDDQNRKTGLGDPQGQTGEEKGSLGGSGGPAAFSPGGGSKSGPLTGGGVTTGTPVNTPPMISPPHPPPPPPSG